MYNLKVRDLIWVTYKNYQVISEGEVTRHLDSGDFKIKLKERSPFNSIFTYYVPQYAEGHYDFEKFFLSYEEALEYLNLVVLKGVLNVKSY